MQRSVAQAAAARWIALVLALAAVALVTSAPTSATSRPTIWVSPSGVDANSGARSAPIRTVAEAWQRVLGHGGTVELLPGTYTGSGYVQFLGAPGGPVTIEAAAKAHVAITDQVSLWAVRGVTLRNIQFTSPG